MFRQRAPATNCGSLSTTSGGKQQKQQQQHLQLLERETGARNDDQEP